MFRVDEEMTIDQPIFDACDTVVSIDLGTGQRYRETRLPYQTELTYKLQVNW